LTSSSQAGQSGEPFFGRASFCPQQITTGVAKINNQMEKIRAGRESFDGRGFRPCRNQTPA
jgi:hypothetical protein